MEDQNRGTNFRRFEIRAVQKPSLNNTIQNLERSWTLGDIVHGYYSGT